MGMSGAEIAGLIQAGGGLLVLGGTLFVTRRLLGGWGWARWVAVAAAGLAAVASVVAAVALVVTVATGFVEPAMESPPTDSNRFDARGIMLGMVAMYSIPVLLAGVCAVTALVCLLMPRTRAWFRLARQARTEHAEQLRSLSE